MQNPIFNFGFFLEIVWIIFTIVNLLGLISLIAIAIKKLLPKLKVKLPFLSVGEIYLENKGSAITFLSFLVLSLATSIFIFLEEESLIRFFISLFLLILDETLYTKMKPKKKEIKYHPPVSRGFLGKFGQEFDSEPE